MFDRLQIFDVAGVQERAPVLPKNHVQDISAVGSVDALKLGIINFDGSPATQHQAHSMPWMTHPVSGLDFTKFDSRIDYKSF